MEAREYGKREIALAQLETALQIYLDGGDMFSVLTLAGAAEEMLGKELNALGGVNALETDQAATDAVSRALGSGGVEPKKVADIANRARNATKHFGAGGPSPWVDPEREARDMLVRATDNYFRLTGDETELMARFREATYG